ncbi:M24 family metallopeptidase [Streptomyces sp. NPDC004126]|uniref:M24 family metallopeptidase n=1 Tax=Streptomyces sp. NPDC004126 TaxID=3390695 RepID=UPI003CFE2CA4
MATSDRMDIRLRSLHLLEGQRLGQRLFAHVISAKAIAPGRTEGEVNDRIAVIAQEVFGARAGLVERRFVRSGPNTVVAGQWPDRVIGAQDVVMLDFESLLAPYETGFARTVAVGDGPARRRLIHDLAVVATAARDAFRADPAITGRALHAEVRATAARADRTLGAWHVGRLTGTAPATHAETTRPEAFISPENTRPLRRALQEGWRAHWILEIRLVDEYMGHAAVHAELLDLA